MQFGPIPRTVLVVNNNPDGGPGHYTQLLIKHLHDARLDVREARTVEDVDACAGQIVDNSGDVGLIISCGSPVVLTEPVNMSKHITKTTAAMLHFPNAPVVGICFGMQLLAQLYGGTLVARLHDGHSGGHWEQLQRLEPDSRLLDWAPHTFTQWASNYIFVEQLPPRFVATTVDTLGRVMSMEHAHEHVYGLQFHPEVIREGVGCQLLEKITSLTGQNRRIKPQHPLQGAAPRRLWHCSTKCRLRRAVKEITHSTCDTVAGSCCKTVSSPDLSERLAAAKREALATLQRDHCKGGGITVAALDDAISTLCEVAAAGVFPVDGSVKDCAEIVGTSNCPRLELSVGRSRSQSDKRTAARNCREPSTKGPAAANSIGQHFEGLSFQDADLRLRAAVRDVIQGLRRNGTEAGAQLPCRRGASTRTTSVGSESTHASESFLAARSSTSIPHVLGKDVDVEQVIPGVHDRPCMAVSAPLTMHDADLRLRREVKELLRACSSADVGKALAVARRSALAMLRQEQLASGCVTAEVLHSALGVLHKAARTHGER